MQTHPWLKKYSIKPESKFLIIGTHPPMPYCGKLDFYYGNMNEFWRFLQAVYPNEKLYNNGCPNLNDILSFLDDYKISITDMIYQTNVERFSVDQDMGKINNDDFNPWLKDWFIKSNVEIIYFTSFSGTNSAKNLFKKWLKTQNYKKIKITKNHINKILLFEKEVILIDLFSPSPTARKSSPKIKEYIEWKSNKKEANDYDSFRIYWYKKHLPKIQ